LKDFYLLFLCYVLPSIKILAIIEINFKVDEKLVKLFAEQIFHTGFVHADPHHGNIFVRRLNNTKQAEIVLLDHGLYEYINETDRRNLCKLWKYIILKNEDKMKFYSAKLNVKGKQILECI
jgi:aarF domain-containing kinase